MKDKHYEDWMIDLVANEMPCSNIREGINYSIRAGLPNLAYTDTRALVRRLRMLGAL